MFLEAGGKIGQFLVHGLEARLLVVRQFRASQFEVTQLVVDQPFVPENQQVLKLIARLSV